jgi:hypothetical protein
MSAGFMIQSGEQPMRVDLRQETEPGDPVLEIPWSDPDRPACRYIDVKRHPEGAIELEECRRYPALGQFLLRVNSPESSFRTAKCDVWATSELELEERLEFAMPCKVGSYVDLMFERADLSSRCEPYKNLAEGLTQRLKEHLPLAQLDLVIRRCFFRLEDRWGYYVTLFLHAYGGTPQDAEALWGTAVELLAGTILAIDRESHWGSAKSTPA